MSRVRVPTPHLFARWARVAKLIRASKRLVVFLDFDGTLVPIAPKPDLVRLGRRTRHVLERLAAHPEVTLALISGRERDELQSFVGIQKMRYLGLYGWECNGNARLSSPIRIALRRARADLVAELTPLSGVWIEPKQHSFSIHLLGAREQVQRRARRIVTARLRPLRDTLQVITNLRDMEVAPASVGGKGAAVHQIMNEPSLRDGLPIYFGDDLSDEPAFRAVRKGISILVGERRTTWARLYLRAPADVATALSRMEAILP